MGQNKLERFAAIRSFSNVFEYPPNMKGRWKEHFGNANPITLELACGKGEYAVGMARMERNKNFIGIDVKGNRIWVGAKTALQDQLHHVAFIRSNIDHLTNYFQPNEVADIWITFPDPQLRFSKAKKRLTHPVFLRRYQQVLSPNGHIHLKTDSPPLFRFTLAVIEHFDLELVECIDDVFGQEQVSEVLKIKTHYEQLDIAGAKRVHYLKFKLQAPLPIEKDKSLKEIIRQFEVD